jgi:hypothetical protein
MGEVHMNKGRVGEDRGSKEKDGCPLTDGRVFARLLYCMRHIYEVLLGYLPLDM